MFHLLWFNRSQRQSQPKIRQSVRNFFCTPVHLGRPQDCATSRKLAVRKKGLLVLFLLLIGFWSMALGIGIARAINHSIDNNSLTPIHQTHNFLSANKILERYQTAQQLYIETCAGCHIPISPSVLPSESWKTILENPNKHYGVSLDFIRITQVLLWEYLATFSRPLSRNEPVPVYVGQARYFKALHPRVDLPKPTTLKTCIVCHPGAQQYDYQSLSPEWENAP